MKLLAFDTSASACSVALLVNDQVTFVHDPVPLQQARLILPKIDELLQAAKVTLMQLDAIAFGAGPGSFTGVRIAVSVAQGLAFASQLPLIPVSSLAAVAQAAYEDRGWNKLLVAIDARIQEVYWATYRVGDDGLVALQGDEIICRPEEVLLPTEHEWYGVGTGWGVYQDKIPFKTIALDPHQLPQATAILALAQAKWLRQEWVDAKDALPVYLRNKVAVKKDTR